MLKKVEVKKFTKGLEALVHPGEEHHHMRPMVSGLHY